MKKPFCSRFVGCLVFAGCAIWQTSTSQAAFLIVNLPGVSTEENWSGLTASNYPGYPTYSTSGNLWPQAIAATSGTGGSELDKVSGLGFPSAGGGIYVGGITSESGAFAVSNAMALSNLETVVFQIEIEGVGADWTDLMSSLTLNVNAGSQSLAATFVKEVSAINTGSMFGQPSTRFTMAFQWDLTAVADPISSLSIGWVGAEHSLASNLQLVQGDTMVQVVPEPSTWFLLVFGIAGAGYWRLARRQMPS